MAAGDSERVSLRIDVDAHSKPEAILFDSLGEFVTGEAVRFCARYGIALIWPPGPGRLVTAIETEAEARDRKAPRRHGVDPAVILAQCAAALDKDRTVSIAREIVRAKIEAQARAVAATGRAVAPLDQVRGQAVVRHPGRDDVKENIPARERLARWIERLPEARRLSDVLMIEAHASAVYWTEFRHVGLRERKGERLPRSWLRHPMRNRGGPAFFMSEAKASKASPKHASHPVNAMLNYAYVVEAGRLARALAAQGFALQIGFLHKLKRGRNSLVWDVIEPLRPAIDAHVFEFVGNHEFGHVDFLQAGVNTWRISRELTGLMLHKVLLPRREIDDVIDWFEQLVLRG